MIKITTNKNIGEIKENLLPHPPKLKDQKGGREGRTEGLCRGGGKRTHDQVHEVLLSFMGNESPVL